MVTWNSLTCKLGGAEVNYYNVSMLVDQNYGRSLTSANDFLISADETIYNFMTYPSKNHLNSASECARTKRN